MITTPEDHLEYLKSPLFIGFSANMFGSGLRLPVLGAILELTPAPEDDIFYQRQVTNLLGTDPGGTLREIKRTERLNMIERVEQENARKNAAEYIRLATSRWSIVETAVRTVREELGI